LKLDSNKSGETEQNEKSSQKEMRGSRLSDWKLKSSGESREAVPTYEGSQMKTSVSRDAKDLSEGLGLSRESKEGPGSKRNSSGHNRSDVVDTDFNTISNSLRDSDDEKGCCIIL
jgi:hypothetical protein